MSKYMTKQRKTLLDFLAQHADQSLSAKSVAQALPSLSVSAVYRNLSDLEEEGRVRRVSQGGSREVYYQYSDAEACQGCLHLLCNRCGKTFHMDHSVAKLLEESLADTEQFRIDRANTVLYGICASCQKKEATH